MRTYNFGVGPCTLTEVNGLVVQTEIDCSEVERKRTRVVELSYGQEVDTTSRIIAGKLQVLKDDIVRETIDAYKWI